MNKMLWKHNASGTIKIYKEAIKLNEKVLLQDSKNCEALNRLSRAYLEVGKFSRAGTNYKKVLKIDPYNTIALKSLERLKIAKSVNTPRELKKNGVWTSNFDLEDKAEIKDKIKGIYELPTNKFKMKIRNIAGDEIVLDYSK